MGSNYKPPENETESVLADRKNPALTTVGLFLIRLVLTVGHAVTSQGVVDAVPVSALKLIDVVTCGVDG